MHGHMDNNIRTIYFPVDENYENCLNTKLEILCV